MFYCEISEIFKNTFFYRTPPVPASVTTIRSYGVNLIYLLLVENELSNRDEWVHRIMWKLFKFNNVNTWTLHEVCLNELLSY